MSPRRPPSVFFGAIGRMGSALLGVLLVVPCSCSQVLTADGLQGGVAGGVDAGDSPVDAPVDTAKDGVPGCGAFVVDCDGTDSNGCETDLRTDASHCGACGHSCLEGACLGGRCQPFTVAEDQDVPSLLMIDGTHLYWTNQGGAGAVMRVEKDGGKAEVVGVTDHPPGGLAVDTEAVYWSEFGEPGTVWRLSKGEIGTATLPTALADGQGQSIALALDGSNVYWCTPATVRTVPKSGGKVTTLARDQGVPFWIVVEGSFVFWTNTVSGQVMRVSMQDVDAGAAEIAGGQSTPVGLATDPANLYWANYEGSAGTPSILRLAKVNMQAPEVLAEGQLGPTAIRAHGSDLFWTNNLGGTIMRMPKVGGAPESIAEGQNGPAGIAVDAAAVYWVNRDDGRVMGVAR